MNSDKKILGRDGNFLGVHSLNHILLEVPDLSQAESYFTHFGLCVKKEYKQIGVYCHGYNYRWMIIRKGSRYKLKKISFSCFESDYKKFADHFHDIGLKFKASNDVIDLVGPDGLLLQIKVGPVASNRRLAPLCVPERVDAHRSAPLRSELSRVHPRRLAHLAIFTEDLEKSLEFYQEALGLRLSDRSRDVVAFMHTPHGSDHHALALLSGTKCGLHHTSWEVSSVDEVAAGAHYMASQGFDYNWGLGRHVLGSNYFYYIRDLWGSWTEYSAGMDYIPKNSNWKSGDYGPEDSFYLWGPEVPAGFTDNPEDKFT